MLKFVPNPDGGIKISTFADELLINTKALKKFDEALKNGSGYAQAYNNIIKNTNGITKAQAKEIVNITRQYRAGKMGQQEYASAIQNTTNVTRTLGVQQKIATVATKALSVALNSIFTIGVTALMSYGLKLLDEIVVTHKEVLETTQKNLETAREEYETLKNNISIYEELGQRTLLTNQEKEQLLNIQDGLIKIYGEEAKSIDLVNGSYEEQIKLLKQLKLQEVQELRDSSQAHLNELQKDYDFKIGSDLKKEHSVNFFTSTYDKLGNQYKEFMREIQSIENIEYKHESLKGQFTQGQISNISDNIEDSAKAWSEVKEVLRKYDLQGEDVFTKVSTRFDTMQDKVEGYKSALNDVAKYEIMIYETENPFKEDFTHKQFIDWKNNLINSFGADEIDIANAIEEQINSMYVEPEIEIIPNIAINKEKIQTEVDKVNLIFSKTELDGETSKNTVFDDLTLIEKAMEESTKNGYIARESFEELIAVYPELENVAKKTSKGYELSLFQMKNAEDDYLQKHRQTIEKAQEKTRDEISLALEELQKAQEIHQRNTETNQPYTILKESEQNLKTAKENYEYLTDTLVDFDNALADLDYDTQITYLDLMAESCSVASSNMKMLSSAFAEINDNGSLSVDTMISLIDSGYASALMYDANTKSVTLNRKQVELLAKTKIESAKAELVSQLATEKHTEAIRQQIQAQINAYDMMLSQWNNIYDGVYGESPSEINSSTAEDTTDYYKENAEAQIKALKQQYELGYISSVDYYNQLLDLVNYFYQGKTEYLDEYADYEKEVYDGMIEAQKERLEEQKEKIQEVNEENEKSIELIKAIQDLENAKKNKTIRSYSEEKGWEYTTDTEAILEADQKLNQLLQEAKEKIIDKEIDAVEKMNLEELKNALNSPLTSLPTNEDIINTAKQQSLEYITNAINNNNQNMNYSINIQNLNTNNANDFLNQMSNLFNQLSNDTVLGR